MEGNDVRALLIEREWRKCAPNWKTATTEEKLEAFEYFCAKYVYIRVPGEGKILFQLRDAQRDTVRLWLESRYSVALKARQIGFSTLVSIFSFWLTFFYADRTVILVSKGEREAKKLLIHARYAAKFLPKWMLHRGPLMTINQEKIEFEHDSVMESAPSAADPARGSTAFLVVVDEFGQLPNDEDAWASIEPVADKGGSIVMLGTANGEGNLFHKTWVSADITWIDRDGTIIREGTGSNEFKGIFHGWWTGDRDDDWYEVKKRNMEPHHLAQEYPSNPDEAFLQSGRPVFDSNMLRAIPTDEPLRGWLEVWQDDSGGEHYEFQEAPSGSLRLWEAPDPESRYVVGVDVAEGLEHGDYSSIHVLRAKTGKLVAHWHGRIDSDLLGSDVVAHLAWWFSRALVVVENNNMGLVTLKALQRVGYFPLYMQRRQASRDSKSTDQLGWKTTVASKPLAIGELNRMLRDQDIAMNCKETLQELRTFRRDERGRMSGQPHDDRVMSLALACQGLKHVHDRKYQPVEQIKTGTVEWFWNQAKNPRDVEEERPVGAFAVA